MTKTVIGNVGVLDLRNTTKEAIAEVGKIGNVGIVICKQGGLHFLHQIEIGNLGLVIEIKENYQLFMDTFHINRGFLEGLQNPLKAVTAKSLMIAKDVTAELIREKIADIEYYGEIYVPVEFYAALQERSTDCGGKIIAYDEDIEQPIVKNGEFSLTKHYLESLDRPTAFSVNGVLTIGDDVDAIALKNLSSLTVNGVIEMRESAEKLIAPFMINSSQTVFTIIRDEYYIVPKPLRLGKKQLSFWKYNKLYTEKPIYFAKDVNREQFQNTITNIESESYIVGPSEIEDLLYEAADSLETDIIAIDEEYIVIDGKEEWDEEALLGLDNSNHIIINGQLTFKDDVTRETLKTKIGSVYLYGKVYLSSALKLTLKQKLEIEEGKLLTEKQDEGTGNIGILKL